MARLACKGSRSAWACALKPMPCEAARQSLTARRRNSASAALTAAASKAGAFFSQSSTVSVVASQAAEFSSP